MVKKMTFKQFLFILPLLIFIGVFSIYPIVTSFMYTFFDYRINDQTANSFYLSERFNGELFYEDCDYINYFLDDDKTLMSEEDQKAVEEIQATVSSVMSEYENAKGTTPYCVKKVAVLNSWGKIRSWGCHMVHHALYQKQNYSYAGIIEALSGAPFDVCFISFDDILQNPHILKDIDVIINVGDGDTAHTGGSIWENPKISSAIREFVYNGGGFVGVGEPSGHQFQGHFLQLADLIGVEKETGFTLNYDKYNWEEHQDHFILADTTKPVDFGEGKKSMYAYAGTEILVQREKEVQMAVNEFGKGRSVYISGLPYNFENSRILYRSILWSAHGEAVLNQWFSTNFNVEVHAYVKNGKFCVVNNTYEPQKTTVYRGDGSSFELEMAPNEIKWYMI